MAPESLSLLKARVAQVDDLQHASGVLAWDQATYMPPGGAPARGRQLATLGRLAHERFTAPEVGGWLEELTDWAAGRPEDDDAALVRVVARDHAKATRLPTDLVGRLAAHGAATYAAWEAARPANDFAAVRPLLETTVGLSREVAGHFPHAHLADPLIDFADDGMTASSVRALFDALRPRLVELARAIGARPEPDTGCLRGRFDPAAQRAFGETVIRAFGYDFDRGRQDTTAHPFMTSFSIGDVRITTRFREDDVGDGLFSTLHEAGHALYEQGVDPAFEGTPLAGGASAGLHESQSRLWENVVGRSRGFWDHWYPALQAAFPDALGAVDVEAFHRAINLVRPSLVRVDADEVTYNLHVMMRFDLELALLDGDLAVADLPAAWRERMVADLGVAPPDDRDGVLQDVHWYGGLVGGAFQGYTLGNVLSAQLYDAAVRARPGIPADVAVGRYDALRSWLTETLYRHGRRHLPAEAVLRATGEPMSVEPYMAYLWRKYGALYGLDAGSDPVPEPPIRTDAP